MKIFGFKLFQSLKQSIPLLTVIAVALFIAVRNIDPNTIYSGWDNIHAEFDLGRYVRQVFFGAWNEHQGLGAPAAQAQLSEIPRLPILFVLTTLLPVNLVRYVFIFLMYLIGGIGMYLYLERIWLQETKSHLKNWLAGLGGIFYLLHILTLQQFYISFEMFMVQFAFLPFLLLTIHRLANKIEAKSILVFVAVQLLIAPSAHTPTVFYLAVLFSLIYGFFLSLKNGPLKSIKFTLTIGLLTLFANAYWILPNIYYTVHNSHYVAESRDNQLFAPESLWSVREAGNLTNFTSGIHYLFSWRDYDFAKQDFDFIFNEWLGHLHQPLTAISLYLLGLITLGGGALLIFAREKGVKRWGVLAMYLFCLAFIWIDLFPTSHLVNQLYQSAAFREAFRNPFTKLSILYSFVSVLLFVQGAKWLTFAILERHWKIDSHRVALWFVVFLAAMIGYTALPSFQGHFISEKLKIEYPTEYRDLFNYMNTRSRNMRVLQLPQFSHVAWEYYDWSFIKLGNGYQGMGFYWFGIAQPFLNRDSDRWMETSDAFFYQLKNALDTYGLDQFNQLVEKYRIDAVIIDESKLDTNRPHNYQADHELVKAAGFKQTWHEGWLTVYEYDTGEGNQAIFSPLGIALADGVTGRVRSDVIYDSLGHYVPTKADEAGVLYPFSDLLSHRLHNLDFTNLALTATREVPAGNYQLTVPPVNVYRDQYFTPVAITYHDQTASVTFPALTMTVAGKTTILTDLPDFQFTVDQPPESLIIFFNRVGVVVKRGETAFPVLTFDIARDQLITIDYVAKPAEISYLPSGNIDDSQLPTTVVATIRPNWDLIMDSVTFPVEGPTDITVRSVFPTFSVDLLNNLAVNCSLDQRGSIATEQMGSTVLYQADAFGVNCGGYAFDHISTATSYVMKLTGENQLGRSTKFFISYSDESIHPEDYLMPSGQFTEYLGLGKLSNDPRSIFYLNWETRSFGKQDINELNSVDISPFPLEWVAQLRLVKQGVELTQPNPIYIQAERAWLYAIYMADFTCQAAVCYVGLDQSYDDLWLAFQPGRFKLLPHFRSNNWANVWQVEGNSRGKVIVVYLPELAALLSVLGLLGWLLVLKNKART